MKKHGFPFSRIGYFILSLLVLVPFAMILLNSFKTKKGAAEMNLSFPSQWNVLENYKAVMGTGVLHSFGTAALLRFCPYF